jgi:hypothetical protein
MTDEKVSTITKDRILTDQVYESPVDRHEVRFRQKLSVFALGIVLLLVLTA